METLKLGSLVPDFELPSTGGTVFRLSELKGSKVLLYFYPKDNTPGCTTESIGFSQHHQEFLDNNTRVFGISRDSLVSHVKFCSKYDFPFELLSDTNEQVCQLFDVIKMKNMYGKQVRGIERSTFLIDESGVLIKEWRKVQVKEHVMEVLASIA